jgi:uncharacterized membrane protein
MKSKIIPHTRLRPLLGHATMKPLFITILTFSLVLLAESFGSHQTVIPVRDKKISLTHFQPRIRVHEPLFVSTEDEVKDSPVLRSIDSKMQNLHKMKEKYTEMLNKYESELHLLNTQKQEYLEGIKLGKIQRNFSETTLRSAIKAILWRIIAGSITFVTSLKFSGDLTTALKIVGSDFFSKAFTMFIGERLMNKSQAGRKTGSDSASRSMVKALVWRAFAVVNTLAASLFFAKDLKMASKIAGSDAIFKTGLMFFYERLWSNIEWGKEYLIEFSI